MLRDNHHRPVNYLRLAVTDRCNLRCFYCMPEEGIEYLPKAELMTYEEMLRIVQVMVRMGIEKLRITGGEPFIRRDMMDFLGEISQLDGLRQINITTNGVVTAPLVPALKRMGIRSVNLSLDTLDPRLFHEITRRDDFHKVMQTLEALLSAGIATKINAVVMEGKNDGELLPLALLSKDNPVDVRFIEEMPFNGGDAHYDQLWWSHQRILEALRSHFPGIEKIPDPPYSTSYNYQIPGHRGTVGIIAAYSRTFCGTCNRLRLTPQGMLKTCLYDGGVFNIKNLLRAGATDAQLSTAVLEALGNRAKDGFEAERQRLLGPVGESMATIGG
ncbi:MAG: GTP 3',8-cyclase MoaA [Saprospiraceae bacterium]|nr:GTP 3',8-cyclase MoaA [Saprospiraceae bacterium]